MILITDANYLATGVRAKGRRYDDTTERLNDWANGRLGEGANGQGRRKRLLSSGRN